MSGLAASKELKKGRTSALFIGKKANFTSSGFSSLTKNSTLQEIFLRHLNGLDEKDKKEPGHFFWANPEPQSPSVGFILLDEKIKMLDLLEQLRSNLGSLIGTQTVALQVVIDPATDSALVAKALGIAVSARILQLPKYGKASREQKPFLLAQVQILAAGDLQNDFNEGFILGEGSHLVRSLGITPANFLNTKLYGQEIKKLCTVHRLNLKFHSNKQLKAMGAGAFTAVDQADPESSGGIYELTYRPAKAKNKSPIALVGKGLCFDTGGYNVKTGSHMITMKGDMQGSAVALATLITASRLKWPLNMKAWLAVTENHISPSGFKPDDVVTALNGMSIEVVDTDAEGRMVLADTLTLATREKPEICIDFATLTGAAVRAVGARMGVALTNDEKLHEPIKQAGLRSGERVWTFPLEEDYGKALESKVADILQCSSSPGPDHIWAAYFLSKFVEPKATWVHIDLSASENDQGLGAANGPFTGFGVLWAAEFIKQQFLT